ncbi:MAG: hypothetical protein M1817_005420 [Caeruleum heppii]|nr:MAG: hypothetical protein M1817_005420 [Caeruleum heppii]
MTSTTPPPLQGPSSKEKKYDRQLRLWAANGQKALEDAHVLLINSGSGVVGVETLKNLILPGIGRFTIIDTPRVTEADLGLNFFLDHASLGQRRAQRTCELLQELNPDVNGRFFEQSTEQLSDIDSFIHDYSLVLLISPVPPDFLEIVSTAAAEHHIPLIYIHSIGYYSHFSVSLPSSFPIVETHPDPTSTTDLRLLNPWPELLSFVHTKTKDLKTQSDHDHGHIPYVVLLLHYLQQWKTDHEGKAPETYKEKTEFREHVRSGARTENAEGGEENYDEAVGAVLKSLNPSSLSSSVRDVLDAEETNNLTAEVCHPSSNPHFEPLLTCLESPNFWLIASALKYFFTTHAALPLPGSLPDMKAQSSDYIELQNIYKRKARKDLADIVEHVRAIEDRLGRKNPVDEKEIEAFCKGAAFVKVVRGRPLRNASDSHWTLFGNNAKSIYQHLLDPTSLMPLYFAFLAHDHCTSSTVAPLHDNDEPPPIDETSLLSHSTQLLTRLCTELDKDLDEETKQNPEISEMRERLNNHIRELARANRAELHNISALTGGMVAQEAIKIITKQYVPVDNVCVFDGVRSGVGVFRV